MTGNIAARRYAQALFSLGRKIGLPELEGYAESLGALRSALAESLELIRVFKNPIFSHNEKKKVIEALAGKLKLKGAIVNFCRLLADKDRLHELEGICDTFNRLLDAEKGVVRGTLLTAIPLNEEKRTAVVRQLEEKAERTLVLEFGVSPEILGGVVLKIGDQVMDASLRAQLSILKDTIKKGE